MKRLMEWITYWGQIFLLPLYWCSRLFPRRKDIWLFGSTFGRRFADNPRYFYQYCRKAGKEAGIRPIWISHDTELVAYLCNHGYEAYRYHSLKGLYYALRGKVYLYDNYSKDINFWQSAGGIKVNMWHGIPLKKIQADNKHDKFRHPRNRWERWKNFPRNLSDEKPSDWVLTTSEFMKPVFSSAFRTKHVFTCGYPRTDYLISDEIDNLLLPKEQQQMSLVTEFQKKRGKGNVKIVYYMPTFRDSESKFFEVMDLGRFQKYLAEKDILFCVKLHPKSKLRKEFADLMERGFENVLVIDADSDPYVLLKITDVLITDYSSVYFDFLLLDRPIIFFDYDREEYISQSRDLYFDYESMTPGVKTETTEGLIEALQSATYPTKEYDKKYADQRRYVREKIFDAPKEMSSPKLVAAIKKEIS